MSQPPLIPDYELLRLIGRGAYGEVWLARGVTGVYRAVKLVWRNRFPEAGPYEREFHGLKEFAAISLSESRQLALLHVGRDPAAAYFYYVMELADDVTTGREIDPVNYTPYTLKEMRSRRGRLPAGECIALGAELARALSGLHARGLVHRDIKPSNVIIVGGAPKLADIGLVTEASAALTFVGTEGFVPPEGPGAPSADVFALGKLLYELVTGLDRHDYPRLPPELHTWPDRKEALELNEVLIRACEPHPDQRHLDAAALLDDLLLLQAGKSIRRLRKAERRLARALRIAAVFALIASVAGLGAYIERQRANQEMAGRLAAEAERDALARRIVYAASIGNAQAAIRRGDYGKARQLLGELRPADGKEDLRGFEWGHLWQLAQGDPAFVLRADGPAVDRLAISPDGRWLAVHDLAATVGLFDLSSRQPVRLIAGVKAIAGFSADASRLLGTNTGQRFTEWRVSDGQIERTQPQGAPYVLGLLPDDRVVALVNGNPARLLIWRVAKGECTEIALETRENPAAPTWEFFRGGVSPDRAQIALAWTRRERGESAFRVTWIDLDSARPEPVHHACPERPSAVGVDAKGAWIAPTGGGVVWRLDRAGITREEESRIGRDVLRLTDNRAGQWLSCDREQLTWRDATGVVVRTGRGHTGLIGDLAVDQQSGRVFSGSHAGEVREWLDTPDDGAVTTRRMLHPGGNPTRLVFSADGQWLAVPVARGQLAVLNTVTGAETRRVAGLRYPVWFTAAELGGVADGSKGGVAFGRTEERLLPEADGVLQMIASADGRSVVATDSQGRLWRQNRDGGPAALLARENWQYRFSVATDPSAQWLWSAGRDNRLTCVDLADGREAWATRLPALAPWLDRSPDGRWLAVPLENASLQLHDPRTGELVRTITLGGSTPQMARFAPDGRRLFVGGSKGDIVVLETSTWLQVAVLQLPTDEPVHELAVAPDGRALAVLTKTGTLHLLRARPE